MPISNAKIANWLERYSNAIATAGAERFKVNAYRRAASTIETLSDSVADRVAHGEDLTDLPGIGQGLSAVIREIVTTGQFRRLDEVTNGLSPELQELSAYPSLNAKDVLRVYKRLSLKNIQELKAALDDGRIGEGLGPRVEFQIRRGLDQRPRMLLYAALPIAARIEERLQAIPGVERIAHVGSLRRREETVGDLNFLIAGDRASTLFRQLPATLGTELLPSQDRRQRAFRLSSGILVTVRWTPLAEWGLNLLLTTGSAAHLRALSRTISPWSIRLTRTLLIRKGIERREESSIYAAVNAPVIEPELREGRGEVEAAQTGDLPALVTLAQIRGDLHMHTTASDGSNTLAEMVQAARQRGYDYIAITDHSQSLTITNGLSAKRLRDQIRTIDRLNEGLRGFRILKGSEVDILDDGRLDYPNELLKELDLTICSIHSKFRLTKEQQTERILRAMDNPYFKILGHATGRLLLRRPGYELDMDRILDQARVTGCHLEINSNPNRLDLSDEHARMARDRGIKLAINTDAHSIHELSFLAGGINQARRAWLAADDILNTRSAKELLRLLRR